MTLSASAALQFWQNAQKTKSNLNLKWPNDILVNEKKVAGILLESDNQAEKTNQKTSFLSENLVNFVILGIGVNINSYPQNMPYLASSLKDEGFFI